MEIESKREGSALTSAEFNQIPDELENVISKAGLTPTKSSLTQVSQSISQMVGDASFYATSGTANDIVLSAISPRLAPAKLTNGMMVRFQALYENTEATSVNVGNLGAKTITIDGEPIDGGKLKVGKIYILTYVSSSDSFELFESGGGGGSGGLEIGDIGFTQMAIDESKGKRRKLNGQLIIQDQYVQFTNIVKASVALNPDLACTESEWQTELTMSANGVCYKFVIDDNAGTIRLPKYPTYLDLSINTSAKSQTVSVYGNGMTLGITTGGTNYGIAGADGGLSGYTGVYGQPVSTSRSGNQQSGSTGGFGLTTDASKSGITGKVTVPAVESEKIKGTYFIQVATGSETEDNIINEIELNNPFSLLDYKFSEYELNNLSWLRSEGQYNSNATYPAVYDLLLKIYNGTETKAGVSVKLWTDESATDYDFRINTAEETFRLPIKVKLASGKAVVGNGMTVGLTDGVNFAGLRAGVINMSVTYLCGQRDQYGSLVGDTNSSGGGLDAKTIGITTDPTKSGIETSDSDLYLYFYVGETVQNANLINAGRIEEKIANIIPDNSELIASYGIPDYTGHILVSSLPFTAPVAGVIYVIAGAGSYTYCSFKINGIDPTGSGELQVTRGNQLVQMLPIKLNKNDILTVNNGTFGKAHFYPLKGAK